MNRFTNGRPKRFALCYGTVHCLSVPNGWMDQDETQNGSRHRPRPHCVRWGPRCRL